MMNFCAIYKVSVIYISCLVIREYLFFFVTCISRFVISEV